MSSEKADAHNIPIWLYKRLTFPNTELRHESRIGTGPAHGDRSESLLADLKNSLRGLPSCQALPVWFEDAQVEAGGFAIPGYPHRRCADIHILATHVAVGREDNVALLEWSHIQREWFLGGFPAANRGGFYWVNSTAGPPDPDLLQRRRYLHAG